MLALSLITIVLLVLVLPITVHAVERNIEAFLFIMGVAAVSCSHAWCGHPVWSWHLVEDALREPLPITGAVAGMGLLVARFRVPLTNAIVGAEHRLGFKRFAFLMVTALGLVSSVITAIMAAVILVEVVSALRFGKDTELKLVVMGCFSIGLGAALTPIGEPLSTIAIAALKGAPHHAGFFFLLKQIGWFVLPGILGIGIVAAIIEPGVREGQEGPGYREQNPERKRDVLMQAGKVYLFVMALVLLGAGLKPIIDMYIIHLPAGVLYWINTLSAVMDNATLAAAEMSPSLSLPQIRSLLMGLLVAGGMLIPGNIPNIICAGRLGIRSRDWARIGVPVGTAIMVVYFIILEVLA